jgi:putative membrane protein
MQDSLGNEALASERTLLAAERTLSAWIRTGLAALGGGLAVSRALVFNTQAHQVMAHVIGGLLVIWGAGIFVYAIIGYHRTCVRLSREGLSRTSLGTMVLMTAMLLTIAVPLFWVTLP